MINSPIPPDEGGEDDHPKFQARFRKTGFPAVAAALCCARMPAPADERMDKHAHEDANAGKPDEPWFGVPRAVVVVAECAGVKFSRQARPSYRNKEPPFVGGSLFRG